MNAFQAIATIVGVVLGLGGLLALVFTVARVKGIQTSLDLTVTANNELRQQLADRDRAQDLENKECASRVAKLEGKVEVLTGDLAERIVAAVVTATLKANKETNG